MTHHANNTTLTDFLADRSTFYRLDPVATGDGVYVSIPAGSDENCVVIQRAITFMAIEVQVDKVRKALQAQASKALGFEI